MSEYKQDAVYAFCDASLRNRRCCIASVFWKNEKIIAEFTDYIDNCKQSLTAEFKAVLLALKKGRQIVNGNDFIIVSDAIKIENENGRYIIVATIDRGELEEKFYERASHYKKIGFKLLSRLPDSEKEYLGKIFQRADQLSRAYEKTESIFFSEKSF